MATTKTTQAFDLSAFIEDENLISEESSRKPITATIKAVSAIAVKTSQATVLLLDTLSEELTNNLMETKLENLAGLHKLASKYGISMDQALSMRTALRR